MTQSLLHQPRYRWSTGVAFGAALLIHFAAIALAHVHRSEHAEPARWIDDFTPITFVDPSPPITASDPDPPDPLPTPPQTDPNFPEITSTPPPVRTPRTKPVGPVARQPNPASRGSLNLSTARVFAVSAPRPEYPYEARRQKITGEGVAAMIVDPASGQVSEVAMLRSTGSPFLDNAALSGFRRWRFKPGTVSSVRCPITFTLTGASY